jgi:menaquinone-dependent protoporphyrinogen oxidase
MRVLVAAASKHGSTREIGEEIAAELQAAGIEADYRDIDEVDDLSGYDAVVLGSGLYMGHWLEAARTFAGRHEAELASRPVWLFSSGPLGDESVTAGQPDADMTHLAKDVHARDQHIFAGRLDPDDLGFRERLIVRVVHAPTGDFRPWEDIAEWARTIAAELVGDSADASGAGNSGATA